MTSPETPLASATILFVNNFAGPGLGGGEVHMRALVRAADDAGVRAIVACHPGSDVMSEFKALGVQTEPLRLSFGGLAASVRRTRKLVERFDVDIVHSNGWLTNAVARLACGRSNVRVINTVQVDPDAPRLSGATVLETAMRRVLDRATFSRADVISPVTHVLAQKLIAAGAPRDRVRVIVGSVDAAAIRARAEAGVPGFERRPEAAYVGVVGRLETVKGIETFVRAAALLADDAAASANVRFVIGGAGPLEGELRATAVALGIIDRVEFLGKVLSTPSVFALLDIVVVPSLSEGFGIVAAEAMALCKPVVASRTGGLAELVEDGATGVLVAPGDAPAMADAIRGLLDDPGRAAAYGEAGRRRVEGEYDASRMAAAYLDLYAELLQRA